MSSSVLHTPPFLRSPSLLSLPPTFFPPTICRACGGVFCYSCTDYMCPVPDEQLYNNVKVCSKCYYRLDGHLRTEDNGPT